MATPETLAEQRRKVYADELTRTLMPPVDPTVNGMQIQLMLRKAHDGDPMLYEEPDEKTWIWSDLHLGHEFSVGAFGRPFHSAQAADKAMHRDWIEHVGDDDAIICLGDISVDGNLYPHHVVRWSQTPGFKVLVLGNHDVDPVNRIKLLDMQRPATRRCC